jgi:arylsulfatase A-like enzyme
MRTAGESTPRVSRFVRAPLRGGESPTLATVGGLIVAGLVAVSLVGCGGDAPPNVVLVTLDTTRADRLGCYGYAAAETPILDAMARSGVRFEETRVQSPITGPSHASILTGTNPTFHGVVGNLQPLPATGVTTMAEVFGEAGYRTGAAIGAFVVASEWGLDRGFDVYYDELPLAPAGRASLPERRGASVVRDALDWIGLRPDEPFFCWVHLFDPHSPYAAPPEFAERFPGSPYDAEIAYVDHCVGLLRDGLDQLGVADHTLMVVTADHGEALGDHGEDTHAFYLYNATLSVPLIMEGAALVPPGVTVPDMVRSIDILPTVLDLVALPIPPTVQGRSRVDAIEAERSPALPSIALTDELNLAFGWAPIRSVEDDGWKYVRLPSAELYDLARDPGELVNLAPDLPDKVTAMDSLLSQVIARTAGDLPRGPEGAVDQATLDRLMSLGYISGGTREDGTDLDVDVTGMKDPKDQRAYWDGYRELVDLRAKGDLARAEAVGRRLLALDDEPPLIHYLFGQVLWHKSQGTDDPALLRETAEHLRRSAIMPEYRISSLVFIGILHGRLGELEEARETFEEVLRLNPDDAMAHFNLTLVHARQGSWSRVVYHGEALLQQVPDHPQAAQIRQLVERARGETR